MMVVMPSFAERQDADYDVVLALIFRIFERLPTPHVANRVHAPGDMVIEKEPHRSQPDKGVPPEAEWEQKPRKEP